MSELKDRWFWAYPTESVDCDGITGSAHEVYSKSDVDSVIAKKDKEIQRLEKLCENYRCDCDDLAIMADILKKNGRSLRQKMNYKKYKLCLAMARWCDAEMYAYPSFGTESPKEKWCQKWHNRWLELSEKFKEMK